jgi:hypothetical protein
MVGNRNGSPTARSQASSHPHCGRHFPAILGSRTAGDKPPSREGSSESHIGALATTGHVNRKTPRRSTVLMASHTVASLRFRNYIRELIERS